MVSRGQYLTILLTPTIITIYFLTVFNAQIDRSDFAYQPNSKVKTIVAYSLKKQLEIEGQKIVCENHVSKQRFEYDLNNNLMWTYIRNINLYVFSVYVDDRLTPHRYLRIIGMYKGKWSGTVYCQIIGTDGEYYVTKSRKTDIWAEQWNKGDEQTFNPVLLSCQIPSATTVKTLTLNKTPCDTNKYFLKVNKRTDPNFRTAKANRVTICVKPLKFKQDISQHLIQWIEINKILGADRINVYVQDVHENVSKILQWYSKTHSNVNVIKYTDIKEHFGAKSDSNRVPVNNKLQPLRDINVGTERNDIHINLRISSGELNLPQKYKMYMHNANAFSGEEAKTEITVKETLRRIWQKRRNELISYNDCFYRNINITDFVLPVDIDEIIIPKQFYSWRQLLGDLFSKRPRLDVYASLSVRNSYYLREYSTLNENETVFFFKDVVRGSYSAKDESGKSFISTNNALTVFNHYALHVLKPGVRKNYFLSPDIVQMNHYRETCAIELLPECAKYLYNSSRFNDDIVMKYKKEFAVKYNHILNQLRKLSLI